ncbi:MAG: glycosyltransferase family 4 protein [Bacteroides sp.]|nr:glycosyltransferase family 4 protein [Bacteroides sp.]
MKILFVFHISSMMGGANISGLNLVRGLRSYGHDVTVLCPGPGHLHDTLMTEGFEVIVERFFMAWPHLDNNLSSYMKFFPKALRNSIHNRKALKEVLPRLRAINPDIVHSNTGVMDFGLKIAKALGKPHITHFREFGYRDTGSMMWHSSAFRKYPRQWNIAITRETADFHRLPASRTDIIYNPVYSLHERRELSAAPGEYILYVGGLYPSKGLEDLIEAYAALPPDLRTSHSLKIAGTTFDHVYEASLRQKCESLRIAGSVEWLGHRDDVSLLMSGAMVTVIPSHNEAFGRTMAEAMFNNCLVIARDAHGLHEQFEIGIQRTGHEIGLRFTDVPSLTLRLTEALTNPRGHYRQMVDDARATVEQEYSTEGNIASVDRLYKTIASSEK